MSDDDIITQELMRGGRGIIHDRYWHGRWWVREYTGLFGMFVKLVQWEGTRWLNGTTGEEIVMSAPRYWVLWWRVRRERRRGPQLPRARVV